MEEVVIVEHDLVEFCNRVKVLLNNPKHWMSKNFQEYLQNDFDRFCSKPHPIFSPECIINGIKYEFHCLEHNYRLTVKKVSDVPSGSDTITYTGMKVNLSNPGDLEAFLRAVGENK